MNDVEIQSLLEEGGYRYDPSRGVYVATDPEEVEIWETHSVADELEIPLEDLQRWEQEQQADTATEGG